jgi:hypothetical protein
LTLVDRRRRPFREGAGHDARNSFEKNSSAVAVLLCCPPATVGPRFGGDMEGPDGEHFLDSVRMREPSGYSHSSVTSRRAKPVGENLSLSRFLGQRMTSPSSLIPSGRVMGEESPATFGQDATGGG